VSLACSAHISWLFRERPYEERVGAASRAGFGLIETAWPQAAERELLPTALAEHGLGVALLNCPAGETERGERGFINDPDRRDEAELGFIAAAELAERLGAPSLNLLVGRALPHLGLARQREAVLEVLRSIAPEAHARGLRLLLEPLNEIENPGYLAPTPQLAVELISDSGCEDVGLLLDVYHVARAGEDPAAAIARHAGVIGHVQVSDVPGRGQPGTGALDIWGILERLDASGYTGSVGLEYEPQGTTETSLAFLEDPRSPLRLGR
jgi:hydroxypyruvate isomerase